MNVRTHSLIAALIPLLWVSAWAADTAPVPAPAQLPGTHLTPIPTAHTERNIEGWTVRVDDRLLTGDHVGLGERALKLLGARLVAITTVVPEKQLAGLRAVRIELDLDYAGLNPMQYHPGVEWLKQKGYSPSLVKCVHIPEVENFLSPFENRRMPWAILHELSHAYHDQVLGFDEPRIMAAWKKFKDSGKYTSVMTSMGVMHEHYGLTNEREFFAEMTESYFGSNDFFPFVAGELKQAEPEIFALMADIWGPLPDHTKGAKEKTATTK
jgi:hypothetical protein